MTAQLSPAAIFQNKGFLKRNSGNLAMAFSTVISIKGRKNGLFYELCPEFFYLGVGIIALGTEIEFDFRLGA